jgi:hypothetical protein
VLELWPRCPVGGGDGQYPPRGSGGQYPAGGDGGSHAKVDPTVGDTPHSVKGVGPV